jgi:hypothetical protein
MKVTFHFLTGKEESIDRLTDKDVDSLETYMTSKKVWWIHNNTGRKLMFYPERLDYVVIEEEKGDR